MTEELDKGIKEGEEEREERNGGGGRDGRREEGSVLKHKLDTTSIAVLRKRRQTAKGRKQYTHHKYFLHHGKS